MKTQPDSLRKRLAELSAAFDRCHVSELDPLHLTAAMLHPVLNETCAASNGMLTMTAAGRSFEGRPIYSVSGGSGPARVLLWSQMHGDESTATRALGDLFRWLVMTAGEPATEGVLSKVSLLAVPMLNPDGAERRTRRTAQGLDMNRDALALRTPEGRLLTKIAADFRPVVSFNLHDQELSTTGDSRAVTALALLAPAFEPTRADNPSRTTAKKIASFAASAAACVAPGRIARYDDGYEPRAFGDLFQKNGYGTVLVESGHEKGDPRKMSVRKLNFIVLAAALERIGEGGFGQLTTDSYDRLPPNGKRAYDVIVRNVTVRTPGGVSYRADLGISRQVDTHAEEPPRLVDAGDLSVFTGMEEIDGSGAVVQASDLLINSPFDYTRMAGA